MKNKKSSSKFVKNALNIAKAIGVKFKNFTASNPVLISGLSLGPVIAISQSLKAGVSLSAAFSIIILPVLVLFAVVPIKFSKSTRIMACCLLSAIFFIPAFWFAQTIFPEVNDKVGVFLPLMVVNPIISSRSADASKGYYPLTSLINGLKTALGFSVVMCLVSAIREIIGNGTIWDVPIGNLEGNISFLLPFMGFILLGFLAAAARKISNITIKTKEEAHE